MKKSDLKKLIREVIQETLREDENISGDEWKQDSGENAKRWQEFYAALDQNLNPKKALIHLHPIFSKELYWQLVSAALLQELHKLDFAGFDDLEPADTVNAMKNFAVKPDTSFFVALKKSPNASIDGVPIKDVPLHFYNFVMQSPRMEASPILQKKFRSKFHMLALFAVEHYKDDLDVNV